MARLIDRLLGQGYSVEAGSASMFLGEGYMKALETATVVVCDNIEAYYESLGTREFISDIEKSLPNVAAPISPAFFEGRPRGVARKDVEAYGALVLTHDLETDAGVEILQSAAFHPERGGFSGVGLDGLPTQVRGSDIKGVRFLTEAWLFFAPTKSGSIGGGSNPFILGRYFLPANNEGAPFVSSPHPLRRTVACAPTGVRDEAVAALTAGMRMMFPVYLAISFMHCKNVERREEAPPPKLSKKWEKKHGRPLVRYHVLDIDPMRKVLSSEGGVETNGLKKALHICRGHFATYTEDKPLFGRVTGTFWKPQHVRGSAKNGVVVKDYNVKAPLG